jgi:hypothetical protein
MRRWYEYGRPRGTHVAHAIRNDGTPYERRDPTLRTILAKGALVLLPMAAIAVWMWLLGAERRAVYALSPDDRAVVYADTMAAFDATCVPLRAGLTEHCRSQASFLLNFPECADHCRRAAAPLLHWRNR